MDFSDFVVINWLVCLVYWVCFFFVCICAQYCLASLLGCGFCASGHVEICYNLFVAVFILAKHRCKNFFYKNRILVSCGDSNIEDRDE